MKKYFIGILLVLLLGACGPGSPPTKEEAEINTNNNPPTAETADEPTGSDQAELEAAEPTEAVAEAEPTDTETAESEEESEAETDTAVANADFQPAQNFTEAAQLRAADYTKGAEEPIVAIIEYGDFQ